LPSKDETLRPILTVHNGPKKSKNGKVNKSRGRGNDEYLRRNN
jgi:hypothetical protein